jgi:hypothetical protein
MNTSIFSDNSSLVGTVLPIIIFTLIIVAAVWFIGRGFHYNKHKKNKKVGIEKKGERSREEAENFFSSGVAKHEHSRRFLKGKSNSNPNNPKVKDHRESGYFIPWEK